MLDVTGWVQYFGRGSGVCKVKVTKLPDWGYDSTSFAKPVA